MRRILTALVVISVAQASVIINNLKTCESLGFDNAAGKCNLPYGFSALHEIKGRDRSYAYVAVLNETQSAKGSDPKFDHSVSRESIHIRSNAGGVLNRVQIYNYQAVDIPRFLRANGDLLRRGDIHYHRDIKMLELFDLEIVINGALHLELAKEDKAGIQIECPVSYNNREPDNSISESACFSPCIWDGLGCWMPAPADYGYVVNGPAVTTPSGISLPLRKFGSSFYGQDIQDVVLELSILTESSVRIKIYDPENARYEVPIAINNVPNRIISTTEFDVIYPEEEGSPFYLQIIRKSTGTVIFDTSLSGLIYEDQLLGIAIQIPSRNIYGLGENYHPNFMRDLDDSTWPAWTRDEFPEPWNQNSLYGLHPHYVVIENDGNAHGVLLFNSNAMEYTLQSGAPAVVFRTIGGILDFYVMTGPTPEDVTKQYTSLTGRTFMPPYWSLGFQICRFGYNNLENMKAAVDRTRSCNIPLDAFYGDIDIMDRNADFTINPVDFAGLSEYVDEQKALGLKFVTILDPALPGSRPGYEPYDRGVDAGVFITDGAGDIMLGNVWPPEPVAFPDFMRNSTQSWWVDEITRFYQTLKFDALWIDMNEPANSDTNIPHPEGGHRLICPINRWDDPLYKPKTGNLGPSYRLSDKTICMANAQGDNDIYRHYDVHSLYAYAETVPTVAALEAATGKRGFVFTRSSFVGSGALGGHWTGDIYSGWDHLPYSVIGMLDFNIFGIPYIGADICGHRDNADERLCERWHQVGAFYPFSRNHNQYGTVDQDPCAWPSTVGESTRKAMVVRYTLLPYLYTTFHRANQGIDGTVVRSLAWEFPNDREAINISRQFLWRDGVLISPVMDVDTFQLNMYLPSGNWFDFYTRDKISSDGEYVLIDVPADHVPVHIRGGRIIPTQESAENTAASRQTPFTLIVALDTDGATANGDLFWDDGDSIDTVGSGQYHYSTFNYDTDTLSHVISNAFASVTDGLVVDTIVVLGKSGQVPSGVTGVDAGATLTVDSVEKITINNAGLLIGESFTVTFTY